LAKFYAPVLWLREDTPLEKPFKVYFEWWCR
jgi:hypothetical protein